MKYYTNGSIKCDKCNRFKIGMYVEQCECEYDVDVDITAEQRWSLYADLMMELSDVLEGGDVAEDFEGNGRMIGVISSINAIVRNELGTIDAVNEIDDILKKIKEEEE